MTGTVVQVSVSQGGIPKRAITPAGFGLVEGGLFGLLHVGLGLAAPAAAAVVLVDRGITVGLLLVSAVAVQLFGRIWVTLQTSRQTA